ncbi:MULTISPECIES: hypothetical protein [Herbaspirillum]|uniref:Uncharacterized protein n=2 Tax=Herbaspirillum huttiense TaxID=863372 RepID=A0AAJ2HAK6_9BURK|nr:MULTISPECIES: hypothetical protein [Herbaspirillum]MDR9836951.1 hypothetical protein [Herbaspirillum huttiense]
MPHDPIGLTVFCASIVPVICMACAVLAGLLLPKGHVVVGGMYYAVTWSMRLLAIVMICAAPTTHVLDVEVIIGGFGLAIFALSFFTSPRRKPTS